MTTMRLPRRLAVGGLTLLVWALAAGSAAWWLLRLGERPQAAAAAVADGSPAGALAVDEQAVARALGAVQAPKAAGSDADVTRRLALLGVLTHGAGGAALIAVDGQPARTVRVAARVEGLEGDWSLRAVAPHAVVLASGAREVRLEMPPPDRRPPASAPAAVPPPPPAPTLAAPPAVMPPVPGLADGLGGRAFPPRPESPRSRRERR